MILPVSIVLRQLAIKYYDRKYSWARIDTKRIPACARKISVIGD